MNLVVGATGMVGTEICRLLALAGKPVRALVRTSSEPVKIERLRNLGATVVLGDLRDRNSLEVACEGIDAVITTASAMPFAYQPNENTPQTTDEDGCLSLIEVAREAGVRRFVYTSFPPMPASFPLQDAKRAVEACLRNSGLPYVILQPTFFMEVWLSPAVGFDHENHKAVIYGAGDNPISWISTSDVARFAVASLDDQIASNTTIELGGPNGVSPLEVVRIFETAGGKAFGLTHVPVEALRLQLEAATDPMQKSFTGLMLSYANAAPIDMSTTLKQMPLKLKTVADHAHRLMA